MKSIPLLNDDGTARTLDQLETDAIKAALVRQCGNVTKAAADLGIGRSTLYVKLATLGIADANR